jgi:hypothetical protein
MPFCPNCKYEYVPGITDCPDCYVPLVDELPKDPEPEQAAPIDDPDFKLVTVGEFGNYLEAEMVQMKLQSEGIEAVLANDIVSRTGRIPMFSMVENPFAVEVRVREEDAERALQIIMEVEDGNH